MVTMARPWTHIAMYEYDVFISYRRTSTARDWVMNYFHPRLHACLSDALPNEPKVFLDVQAIEPGAIWQSTITRALKNSKFMIAVLNGPYFSSQYCRAEWDTFVDREKMIGAPGTLIAPIRFFDGDYYDPSAKSRQLIDMTAWATSAPAFKETQEFLRFEKAVRDLAERLAAIDGPIMNPVGYQAWPVCEPAESRAAIPIPQPRLGA
jgi:hypothetical protein